jgi:hypothetical protein
MNLTSVRPVCIYCVIFYVLVYIVMLLEETSLKHSTFFHQQDNDCGLLREI